MNLFQGETKMSKLDYFINGANETETREITVSDRFKDEKGNLATIKIKSITQAENDALIKRATIKQKNRNGTVTEIIDKERYTATLLLNCIVEPDFQSSEFVSKMGVADPVDALMKLFRPGEYAKISEAVLDLMGINMDIGDVAKNS